MHLVTANAAAQPTPKAVGCSGLSCKHFHIVNLTVACGNWKSIFPESLDMESDGITNFRFNFGDSGSGCNTSR